MKFSIRQILASVAGAVLAAIIASVFGVKGTIVGVAIGSAAATIGTALVAQSIERGHEAVRQAVVRTSDTQSNPLLRRLGGTAAATAGPDASDQSSGTDTVSSTTGDPGTTPMVGPVVPAGESERQPQLGPDRATTKPGGRGAEATPTQRRFTWKALAGTAGVVFAGRAAVHHGRRADRREAALVDLRRSGIRHVGGESGGFAWAYDVHDQHDDHDDVHQQADEHEHDDGDEHHDVDQHDRPRRLDDNGPDRHI